MVGLAVVMALSIGFAGKAEAKEKVVDKDPDGNQVASGELLVTYKRDASERARDEAPKKVGGQLEQDFSEIKVQHLSLPEVKNERDPQVRQKALEQKKRDLERDPAVEAVDYNYRREAGWVPNDPHYGLQWGYPKIRAPQAWDITQGSSTVKVAVLDGGIDNNHADLQGKVVRQYDFGNGDTDASPNANDNGHGTHVAGTVAASTNNGKGVAGSCPNCSLLFAKVFDSNGQVYDSYVVPALNWSANNGARVINMSFGGPGYSSALETAINNAWNKQAVLVASAMNNGTSGTKYYPAAYDNVMAVAATDKNDQKYYWSNSGDWVDVAAPGVDIYSTTLSEWVVVQDFSGVKSWKLVPRYAYSTGTSMAAPHVSGLAGLILSKNAGLTNKEVRYRIERTAVDLVSAGWSGKDPIIGSGRIDAYAALNYSNKAAPRPSVKG
jgi:thermitase